jgi:hypothetical protein
VEFKQDYYGYQGAVEGWKKLCKSPEDEIIPGLYLPWIPTNVWAIKKRTKYCNNKTR